MRGLGLSRELWTVQVGTFLNTLGWGAVLPFEIIYLHNGRGFSLGTSGLVVGVITGMAVVTGHPGHATGTVDGARRAVQR